MFEFLKSRKGHIPQPPRFVKENLPTPGLIIPEMVMLRAKKWVTVKGRVGIVVSADSSGYVKVDLTNQSGETVEQIRVPVGEVRLAKYTEIPEPRRGDPIKAATLGYV